MNSGFFLGLIVAVFIAQAKADCVHEGHTLKTGEQIPVICGIDTCNADGSLSGVGCGVYQCAPGKQIGQHAGDKTKVYPDCCDHPICSD